MKKILLALLVIGTPLQAMAMTAKELLALVAMPLAVAAVADVAHVPQDQLTTLVSQLNQAEVPPYQFVQLLRYTPPALVVQPQPQVPTLVQFVQDQTSRGMAGPTLVTAIEQQLPAYGVTPVAVTTYVPATTFVLQPDYIPPPVIGQLGGAANPLALIAMPLAVAAVSELTGVPQDQLASFVATLNEANVPPTEFVQVMRYVPVALVADGSQGTFVQYVQTQASQGITGPALVTLINSRLPDYGIQPQPALAPASQIVVVDNRDYIPPAVTARVAEARQHPHGGPPGQLKKIYGLQTGAEVVHGTKPGRQFGTPGYVAPYGAPPRVAEKAARRGGREHPHGNPHRAMHGQSGAYPPPMISGAPEAKRVPPGRAKKMERAPVMVPPEVAPPPQRQPHGAPSAPPGQMKKEGGAAPQGGPPAGVPPGQAKKGGGGHGHGKE